MPKHPFLFLLIGLGLLFSIQVRAQQESHYSMYMLNPYAYNPGFAGMDYSLSATGVFRRQWVDLDFTPTTQQINVHAPIAALGGGIGLNFDNDEFGAERRTRFGLGYAYHMPVGKGTLSIGLRANLMQRSLDASLLRTPEGTFTDGIFDPNDPIISTGNESGSGPSFDFGFYYKNEVWEAGLGISNVTESSIELTNVSIQNSRTLHANFALALELTYNVTIKPGFFVQSDLNQTQTAVSVMAEYNDNLFGGVAFRGYNNDSRDALVIMGGFKISNNIKLGYSYDVTLSDLQLVSSGSHEILLNYNLNKRYVFSKPPNTIYHPRAF